MLIRGPLSYGPEIILATLSKRPFKTTEHILFESKTTYQKQK